MIRRHVLSVGGRRVHFRLTFGEALIEGAIDLPSRLRKERHRQLVQEWIFGLCRELDPDPRPFRLVVTQGARVRSIACEAGGTSVCLFS